MELQDVFYWMAIVYMTIMFVLMIAGVVAVFAIKKKIDHIHAIIDDKIQLAATIVHTATDLVEKARNTFKKTD